MVLDDADIDKAVKAGIEARLSNAGQVCTGAKRFIVQRPVADAFLKGFVEGMHGAVAGDPLDPDTVLGPLSSGDALDGLTRQVEAALAGGARALTGGQPMDRTGFFYEPTVLVDISPDNPAYYQEFFGPVAQVFVVDGDDAVVAQANDSPFGLGGSIFSGDIQRARRLASRIETGMVFINTATTSMPELPFGGIKRSGSGRELGEVGLKAFVNRKLVVVAADPESRASVG